MDRSIDKYIDADLDGMVDPAKNTRPSPSDYADGVSTQLRKGYLAYCVLTICSPEKKYTSEIIARLRGAEMVVVEGTIYPLLSRLLKDGLLAYEWQESEQGPPRKYYKTTEYGDAVLGEVTKKIEELNKTLKKL